MTARHTQTILDLLLGTAHVILRRAQGDGWRRFIRYALARLPNSIYPVNLELQGLLPRSLVLRWSVLKP